MLFIRPRKNNSKSNFSNDSTLNSFNIEPPINVKNNEETPHFYIEGNKQPFVDKNLILNNRGVKKHHKKIYRVSFNIKQEPYLEIEESNKNNEPKIILNQTIKKDNNNNNNNNTQLKDNIKCSCSIY